MQPAQKHACAQQPTQLKAPHPTEKAPQQVDRLACEGGGAADTGTPICATIWPKRCWRGTDPCQHSAPFNHPMCEVAVPVLPLSPGHSKLTRQNIQGTLQELAPRVFLLHTGRVCHDTPFDMARPPWRWAPHQAPMPQTYKSQSAQPFKVCDRSPGHHQNHVFSCLPVAVVHR